MKKLAILCLLSLFASCQKGTRLIGLDITGIERSLKINDDVFSSELGGYIFQAFQATETELLNLPIKDDSWEVNALVIGIGIEGELDILKSWQFKASPAILVAIQKNKEGS